SGGKGFPSVSRRIVALTIVQVAYIGPTRPTPDDHLSPGPYRAVTRASDRCAISGHPHPTIAQRIVTPAVVERNACVVVVSTPDNHLRACPHRRMKLAWGGRAGDRHDRPTVRRWVIAPATVR